MSQRDKLIRELGRAAADWSDLAVNAVAKEIARVVPESDLDHLISMFEIANAHEEGPADPEFEGLAEAYRAEDETASRRPGVARLSSTLRSEIGYEDARR